MLTPVSPNVAALQLPDTAADESPYLEVQGLWADLEAALSLLLNKPTLVQQLPHKVVQLDTWLQELIAHDSDSALYLMFQLAGSSLAGYSASHALVCATLSHILAQEFALEPEERNALVRAAFTMNIGMTALQDQLALQRERPSVAQQEAIRLHAAEGCHQLASFGVQDALWLEVVRLHHIHMEAQTTLMQQPAAERLARILATCDRYAAMISPRRSRLARSVTESVQAITGTQAPLYEQAGQALIRCVGQYPPGVYVALSSGETAVVVRRTLHVGYPLVATLLDARKVPVRKPQLIATHEQQVHITHALPIHDVNLHVDHRTLVHLGIYAARFSDSLQQLVCLPGAR
jgi:hypothetical protein